MRIALGVEYDGSAFKGWQLQRHAVRVICAGRTDTGVHAVGQVVHFETTAERAPRNWLMGANVNLPPDVAVNWALPVNDEFHARFMAQSRQYRYLIMNRPTRSSLLARHVTWVHQPLDAGAMHAAGQVLVGTHDFSSYRALGCQAKSPVRTLHSLAVVRRGELIDIRVHANAFLHHMIRNIAGVLIAIGRGDRSVDWAAQVLAQRDRTQGGVTAPPDGLYLERVWYPNDYRIPAPPPVPLIPAESGL